MVVNYVLLKCYVLAFASGKVAVCGKEHAWFGEFQAQAKCNHVVQSEA
jgi:hypothetical protein